MKIINYIIILIVVNVLCAMLGDAVGQGKKKKAKYILLCAVVFGIGILVGVLYILGKQVI